jgi:hypothetical protein
MTMTNTPAYYDMITITAVKCFILETPVVAFMQLFLA